MKKILASILAIVTLFILTACGQAKKIIDLEKTKEDISALKTKEVSRINMVTALSMTDYFLDVTEKYDFDLKKLDIKKSNIANIDGMYDFSFAVNTKEKVGYFIGKPAKEKKESLTKELNKFFEKYKYETKEIEGYLVYVSCSNNADAFKIIEENTHAPLMNGLTYTDVEMVLGENTKELVSEGVYALPSFITSAEQYIIIKPSKGNEEEVKEKMDEYMSRLKTQWDTYLPLEAQKVNDRMETSIGDYLIYIISSDNDAVLKAIKKNVSE